nr:MAG TPA: hypothetical protein [Caudoviricetes sp.]
MATILIKHCCLCSSRLCDDYLLSTKTGCALPDAPRKNPHTISNAGRSPSETLCFSLPER